MLDKAAEWVGNALASIQLAYHRGRAHGGLQGFKAADPNDPFREPINERLDESDNRQHTADRIRMMMAARWIRKNHSTVGHGLDVVKRYCIPTMYQANTGDADINTQINDYLLSEMEAENFDYEENSDAQQIWGMALTDFSIDGDHFQNLVLPAGERSFRAQCFRADRVGDCHHHRFDPLLRRTYRHVAGINLDRRNRRRSIEVWSAPALMEDGVVSASKGDRPTTIPWSQILHLYDPMSTDSKRGTSHWHAAIDDIRDALSIWENEVRKIEGQSGLLGVVNREGGRKLKQGNILNNGGYNAPVNGREETPDGGDAEIRSVSKNRMLVLGLREKWNNLETQVNESFVEFMRPMLRSGAWAVRLPYAMAVDSKGVGGSELRFLLSESGSSFQYTQGVLVKRYCNPWKKAKIIEGITNGKLPGLSILKIRDLCKGEWIFPATPTADEKYRDQSLLRNIEAGVASKIKAIGLQGGTHEQVVSDNGRATRREFEEAKKLWESTGKDEGMPLEWWVDRIASQGANGSVPYDTEEEPKPGKINPEDA